MLKIVVGDQQAPCKGGDKVKECVKMKGNWGL